MSGTLSHASSQSPGRIILRAACGVVAAFALYMIYEVGIGAVWTMGPLAFAALLPALENERLTGFVESWEQRIRAAHSQPATSNAVWRRFLRAFRGAIVWLMGIAERRVSGNRHLRAGLNVGAMAFVTSIFASALMLVFWAAIFVLIAVIALFAVIAALGSSSGRSSRGGIGGMLAAGAAGAAIGSALSGKAGGGNPVVERLKGKRIVNNGVLADCPTGLMVDNNGRLVQEGFFNSHTGYRIADDGRIVKEGFVDSNTGVRITEDGRIVKDGFFGSSTQARITDDGRVVKDGFFGATDTGTKFR
jgi:hypothetical protein